MIIDYLTVDFYMINVSGERHTHEFRLVGSKHFLFFLSREAKLSPWSYGNPELSHSIFYIFTSIKPLQNGKRVLQKFSCCLCLLVAPLSVLVRLTTISFTRSKRIIYFAVSPYPSVCFSSWNWGSQKTSLSNQLGANFGFSFSFSRVEIS